MRIIIAALLGFLAVSPIAADTIVDQAKLLMNSNQEEKAVAILEGALAVTPNDAVRHYWLGRAYGAAAEVAGPFRMMSLATRARDQFAAAVTADPNFIDARSALLEFYLLAPGFMGGGIDKATEQATQIRRRDAAAGHRAFAEITAARKDMNGARSEYAAAIRENPASPKPHYWYALFSMLTIKDYKTAAGEFEAALRIEPNYMAARYQLGHLAALSGANLARGQESLEKYVVWNPGDDDPPLHRAHYWLGLIYEKQGKRAEARAQYQVALRLRPNQKESREALKRVS